MPLGAIERSDTEIQRTLKWMLPCFSGLLLCGSNLYPSVESYLRQKRKSLVGSSSLRQVQIHGLVPVDGSPDGRCGTILSSEVFVARMLQLIKKFAMTESRGNFYQSYEGLIPAIFSMPTKRDCIGACFQIKPMPSQEKCAQEERKVRRESQC